MDELGRSCSDIGCIWLGGLSGIDGRDQARKIEVLFLNHPENLGLGATGRYVDTALARNQNVGHKSLTRVLGCGRT